MDPSRDRTPSPVGGWPHVVIVGGGFGGLACARALRRARARVTVVDRRNYHLFAPLLYQVATAALSPADIAAPIRKVLRREARADVVMAEVTGVDAVARRLELEGGGHIPYDVLILAPGSVYNYFGHEDWARAAPGLKTIDNARRIRAGLLRAYEEAETEEDPARRRALMTTVVVGGGPTGVEMAGAIAELSRYALARDFRRINPASASILLVEAGPRLLSAFPERLSAYAQRTLERMGVRVLLNTAVESVEPDAILAAGRRIPASTIVWGAGIRASPAAAWLGVEPDRLGRIKVNPDLSVPGFERIYAIGDTARFEQDGKPLPALAQVANQQGRHLGRALAKSFKTGEPVAPFRFRDRGDTATIGRHAAVYSLGRWRMKGYLAWVLWALVHIYLLIGFEKRLLVATQWAWRYLTFERGARLID